MALSTGNPFVDALGAQTWGRNDLTVNFENEGAGGAWTFEERSLFFAALRTWEAVADIRFTTENNRDNADLVERKETAAVLGADANGDHQHPQGANPSVGRYNTSQPQWNAADLVVGGRAFSTFVHEIGHALGLDHPHPDPGSDANNFPGVTADNDTGDNALNRRIFTVMSYNRDTDPAQFNRGHVATPMAFDIAAIQETYGANTFANSGNNRYVFGANGIGTYYSCIWDTDGTDSIEYGGSANATLDLRSATLQNAIGGGGYLSGATGIDGGFTIAADFTNVLANRNGETGVIIENAAGGEGHDTITGNTVRNFLTGNGGNDTIIAGDGNDDLHGGLGRDVLNGGDGNDRIFADVDGQPGGNDDLIGGIGADRMFGGRGNDRYFVDHASDGVFESEIVAGGGGLPRDAGGEDQVRTSIDFNLPASSFFNQVEDLVYTGVTDFVGGGNNLDNDITGGVMHDTLTGLGGTDVLGGRSGNDRLEGGAAFDLLIGGSGFDSLDGGTGDDVMRGGNNNDSYIVDSTADEVFETATGGDGDTVYSYATFTLPDHVEALALFGAAAIDGFGNGLDNFVGGNSGANVLEGRDGKDNLSGGGGGDTIRGGEGDDKLNGGTGTDALEGGNGNDTYDVDSTADVVTETAGGGTDLVRARASFTLTADVENLTLQGSAAIDGFGNALDNTILGNNAANIIDGDAGNDTILGQGGDDTLRGGNGNDTLDGGTGADAMQGGADDDTYILDNAGDTVFEAAGEGIDLVRTARTGLTLASNVENLFIAAPLVQGSPVFTATGNGLDNVMSGEPGIPFRFINPRYQFFGLNGADTLNGGEARSGDTLDGGADNDTLNGGGGGDILIGGAGADALNGGGFFDTADYTLATSGVSLNLALGGSAGEAAGDTYTSVERVNGSEFGDSIVGDGANNILRGFGGDDFLTAGLGADILQGGDGDDNFSIDNNDTVAGGAGVFDQVNASADTIASGFIFAIAGTGVERVQGNDGHDQIDGSGVDDDLVIAGHGGNDVIQCGAGNDGVFGGAGQDTISGGLGFDQLHGQDGNDTMTGGGGGNPSPFGDWLFGGEGDDFLTATGNGRAFGDGGNDVIFGSAGDLLVGGTGDDTIHGGEGLQQIIGDAGNDTMDGGGGFDRFDFADGWGADTIADFQVGIDQIAMFDVTGLDTFSQLVIANVAGGARVAFGADSFVLQGLTAAQVVATDFLL